MHKIFLEHSHARLHRAPCIPQQQRSVRMTETAWLSEPKVCAMRPLEEVGHLLYAKHNVLITLMFLKP